jgi:hypothetical protein
LDAITDPQGVTIDREFTDKTGLEATEQFQQLIAANLAT